MCVIGEREAGITGRTSQVCYLSQKRNDDYERVYDNDDENADVVVVIVMK